MEVVAERGFEATVDEIAQLSGVSPRTIFRHYVSHDRLIAATVRDMFEECGRYPIESSPRIVDDLGGWIDRLPKSFDDLDAWLEKLAVTVHTRTARIFGRAFWDIHAPNPTASAALSELAVFRRQYRLQGVGYLTAVAWRTAGGVGDPPEDLVLAFALNLSAFTTHSLMIDFDKNPTEVGVLTADILKAFVRTAVEDQRGGGSGGNRRHRRSIAATE
ncbi:MAG: helix-turn-helix domain-containing protein [Acidimicrobiales bacterium]|jgi:AcrR family transcriptional regulator